MVERLSSVEIPVHTNVDDYSATSSTGDQLAYPGERPGTSYVTDGITVTVVEVKDCSSVLDFRTHDSEGVEVPLDVFLDNLGAAPMSDRIPILAYGANLSPPSLRKKYEKVGRGDALVIPTIYSELPGYDVVWSAGPNMLGKFIASLYKGEETAGTSVQVGLNFLTREQVLVMHATELAYDLYRVSVPVKGSTVQAYVYAGKDSVHIADDGRPVAIESIPASNRRLSAASSATMLEKVLENQEVMQKLRTVQPGFPAEQLTPTEYIEYVDTLRKTEDNQTPRGDLKQRLYTILGEQGLAKVVDVSQDESLSWANPSTLPTYGESLAGVTAHDLYVLPSSELPQDQWPDAEARKKVLSGIREHFHWHFPQTIKSTV